MVGVMVRPQDQVADGCGFEAFREAVSRTFVPLLAETKQECNFAGSITSAELGPLLLAQVAAGAHVVRRSSRLIRRADLDCYKLSLQVAGRSLLIQDDRTALMAPGDMAIYDTTRPYELRFDAPFRMIVLMFPRSLLQVSEASVRLMAGQRIRADGGLGGLVGAFVAGLPQQADQCSAAASRLLADAVLDMLAAALAHELGSTGSRSQGPRQAVLLQQIRSFIEDQLADPELGPSDIAAAHHISTRYLRKLFEAEGDSVARWIRTRRLEHCRRDLGRADLAGRSVSAVAARWGFTDAAHFSRLFKATFGQSPREYRHHALGPAWCEQYIETA